MWGIPNSVELNMRDRNKKRFTYIAPPGDLISTRVGPKGNFFSKITPGKR